MAISLALSSRWRVETRRTSTGVKAGRGERRALGEAGRGEVPGRREASAGPEARGTGKLRRERGGRTAYASSRTLYKKVSIQNTHSTDVLQMDRNFLQRAM